MDQILLRFDPTSVVAGAMLPLGIAAMFALLFIPSLLNPGAKPSGVAKAAYCYVLQALGIFFMSAGGLPAVYGMLGKVFLGTDSYSTETYLALLLLFAVGGLLFLWHEQKAERIDYASRAVSAAIFWFTFKTVGLLLSLFSGLSVLLTMLLVKPLPADWWVQPLVLLFYGLLLSWCTRVPKHQSQGFSSSPMASLHHTTQKKAKKSMGLPKLRRA